jgi:hypothetical protein
MTVRRSPAGVVATDGPFAELKEVLASFAIIDVASQERGRRDRRPDRRGAGRTDRDPPDHGRGVPGVTEEFQA